MKRFSATPGLLALVFAGTAQADIVQMDDVIIQGELLCVGSACVDGEPHIPIRDGIKIKDFRPTILFEDTSTTGGPTGYFDWQLAANGSGAGDAFYLQDVTSDTIPVYVEGGAPNNALFVASSGRIGLGTSMPTANLQIEGGNGGSLSITGVGTVPYHYNMSATDLGFFISSFEPDTRRPFSLAFGAPTASLAVIGNGNVGLGTFAPSAPLEVWSDENFNFFRITANGAAVNESVDITFTGGPLGTGQLRYNIVDGDNQEMSLDADGNMVLDGTLTTAGPTCSGGCDRVFDDTYALLSIEDHAKAMHANRHLPAIGATTPGAPINVTEKLGRVINELEHAHLYIEQLHKRLEDQETRLKQLEAARLQ